MIGFEKIRNQKGQALVEMALVLPILLMLVFGIIEFGRIFNAYIVVSNASREGARYAAVGRSLTDIETDINNLTSTLGTVTILVDDSDDESVKVTVKHPLPLITPIIGPMISGSNHLDIESSTVMRVE